MGPDPEAPPRLRGAIIHSKLQVPPLPDRFAARPRLSRTLGALLERKRVIALSATAGSGKTTAIVEALGSTSRPVAWLTVDRPDAAPGRLITYLEAALAARAPLADGAATVALADGIQHAEAAGILADAIGDLPLILVIDDLERLGDSASAWAVVEAIVRYAPPRMTTVLLSRRPIPFISPFARPDEVAVLDDADLAFTREEAANALERCGKGDIDAAKAVDATSGWVTGVLFEAWRSTGDLKGLGGDTDPLYGYLASQILGALAPAERDFLEITSLFSDVTAPRAQALGLEDARETLQRLRSGHLPATWSRDGRTMRCHTFFRDYLLDRLENRSEDEVRRTRLSYARRLVAEHDDEGAVEAFLRARAPAEALAPAERAILGVIDRLDFSVADRWLRELADVHTAGASPLTTAELMLAIARDDVLLGTRTADRLAALDERNTLAAADERAACLMAWAYSHVARWDDVEAVLSIAPPGPDVAAVRYAISVSTDLTGYEPESDPAPVSGPVKAIAAIALYCRGELTALTDGEASRWVAAMEGPWRIGALRGLGRTQQALDLLEAARPSAIARMPMMTFVAPDVLLDAGRAEEARRVLDEGRRMAAVSGSVSFLGCAHLMAAKVALRVDRDPAAALEALDHPGCRRAAAGVRFVAELRDTWRGLALLLLKRDGEALACLRSATQGMQRGRRLLELPTAAIYLAEAEWRAGNDEAAEHAATLALQAARRQGSNHILMQALAEFPAVAARQLDVEHGADADWHRLRQALTAQGVQVLAPERASVELVEFGRRALLVDGSAVKPRLAKSYELLAYLLERPERCGTREEMLDALFGERRDESTKAYLRTALMWLRRTLPAGALVESEDGVRVDAAVTITSESLRLERALTEAARLQGEDRLEATLSALEIYDRGEYLPGPRGPWGDERHNLLADRVNDARYQAAVLAFGSARYEESHALVREVLRIDPLRETGWRLVMRIAQALGDADAVVKAYRACEETLAGIAVQPSASTRRLLETLRA